MIYYPYHYLCTNTHPPQLCLDTQVPWLLALSRQQRRLPQRQPEWTLPAHLFRLPCLPLSPVPFGTPHALGQAGCTRAREVEESDGQEGRGKGHERLQASTSIRALHSHTIHPYSHHTGLRQAFERKGQSRQGNEDEMVLFEYMNEVQLRQWVEANPGRVMRGIVAATHPCSWLLVWSEVCR